MSLGSSLFEARKNRGLSQEEVAEKLGVSRQTISKWETDETLPDIRQSKRLAVIYRISLDELIDFDIGVKEIEEMIERTDEKLNDKINWTKVWSKKYPILAKYQDEVDISDYAENLKTMLKRLRSDYGYSAVDACLVLKDILAHVWKN
ncbi:MAG: helix-turn-helix transcriptional regulator [Eubacterium sp.]|uniref:helix-turn-helix transcriptional regulator n=1 Tax=Eubacterium sp. TaxID=142586 RepID=UPI003A3BEFFB